MTMGFLMLRGALGGALGLLAYWAWSRACLRRRPHFREMRYAVGFSFGCTACSYQVLGLYKEHNMTGDIALPSLVVVVCAICLIGMLRGRRYPPRTRCAACRGTGWAPEEGKGDADG